jgi:hypothetical protein
MSLDNDLLTINEASRATGKSIVTIRKYLGLTGLPSKLPNARKLLPEGEKQERWQIPLSDLYNAGLMKGNASKSTQPETEAEETLAEKSARLSFENELLRVQVELLERNRIDLEQHLADLRLMLGRSIETKEKQEERKKRFWQRS